MINGKQYVGQTWKTVEQRWRGHCRAVNKMLLGKAIRKYGAHNFNVEPLVTMLTCSQDDVDEVETAVIRHLNTLVPNGYNLREGGNGGRFHLKTREKIRDVITKKYDEQEYRVKVVAANKKLAASPEWHDAMRNAMRRKYADSAWRAKKAAINKELAKSSTWRAAVSAAAKTRPRRTHSPVTRARMSEARRQWWTRKMAGTPGQLTTTS